MLERLHLRPELGAFEPFLRDRITQAIAFDDERFARVRGIERGAGNALTIVSQFVSGSRLCDLLEAATSLPADEATSPSVDAALGFLLEVLPALGSLHTTTRRAHGTLGPGRIVLTPAGQVVILDCALGQAIERLQFNRRRLWLEFGIAMPSSAGPARLDFAGDIAQASLAAMMIVVGRPLRENEYPDGLAALLTEVIEIAQIRGSGQFASGLQAFLERTLPLPSRRAHASAEEAVAEIRHVAREIGGQRCRAALTSFIVDVNRILADTREWADMASSDPDEDEIAAFAIDDDMAGSAAADTATAGDFPTGEMAAAGDTFSESPFDATDLGGTLEGEAASNPPEMVVSEPTPAFIAFTDEEPTIELTAASVTITEPSPVDVVTRLAEPIPAPPVVVPEPVVAVRVEPAPMPVPLAVAPEPAAAVPEAIVAAPSQRPSKRKRRGSKPHRDKLRSNALPAKPAPTPVAPAPPPPPMVAPAFGRTAEPWRQEAGGPVPGVAIPVARPPIAVKQQAPLRVKTDGPAGYNPAAQRNDWRESNDLPAGPYGPGGAESSGGEFPWRLAAAVVVVIIIVIGVGRAYLPDQDAAAAESLASTPAIPTKHVEMPKGGSIAVTTQPAGAHVLLDGKAVGDTPVTLDNVTPGKHSLTLVTSAGSVKKVVRVESGKTVSIDVPIYSGWIAVFAPVTLDISENGRAIGTTEQGRLMLSPGKHILSFSNRELGYRSAQTVEIEPGEERSISIQPTGTLNANAVPWAEVWMDGKKIGDTPMAGVQVPLGTHEVTFKNPQFPERRTTVTINATKPTAASVDFSK